jgi:hypothetical protein
MDDKEVRSNFQVKRGFFGLENSDWLWGTKGFQFHEHRRKFRLI